MANHAGCFEDPDLPAWRGWGRPGDGRARSGGVTAWARCAVFVTWPASPLGLASPLLECLCLSRRPRRCVFASADDQHPKPPHPPEPPNILRGGSFEHPRVRPGTSHPFAAIRGWHLAYGPDFELQNGLVGPAANGEQYAELDSDASTGIFQRVHTHADRNYRLEFCAAARPGTPPEPRTSSSSSGSATS